MSPRCGPHYSVRCSTTPSASIFFPCKTKGQGDWTFISSFFLRSVNLFPFRKNNWGCSLVGRTHALHAWGHRFETVHLHPPNHFIPLWNKLFLKISHLCAVEIWRFTGKIFVFFLGAENSIKMIAREKNIFGYPWVSFSPGARTPQQMQQL